MRCTDTRAHGAKQIPMLRIAAKEEENMNKKKMLHRLLAFVLAVTFILGSAITVGAATESGGSTTDKTLAELRES